MRSNPDTIKIVHKDEPGTGEVYELQIDGGPKAQLMQDRHGKLYLDIMIAGAFAWAESRVLIQGLVKLAELGDQLAGNKTDVQQLLHEPTIEEIEMATKAKSVKAKKKAAKERKVTGEKRETAAALFQELIMAGTLTDDKIFAKVKDKFDLDDNKRSYVAWYRNKLTKDGKKPPAAKE